MGQVVDLFLVYQFIKRLSTPFEETKAYELGLIDEKGKRLKKASTRDEKNAMTYYDRLIFNLKTTDNINADCTTLPHFTILPHLRR